MSDKITVEKILAGDVRAAAKLIRDIDDDIPEARDILKRIYPYTGNAYVIGITGAPGVGKSTLTDQMIKYIREQGKTVGIIAIDPTSPFTGGAILGDRIRMQRHSMDDGVFIRSMATRGHFGGLTQSTRGTIHVLDAMGKDIIIVETVGVGQDEVDVVKSADSTAVIVVPGMGDDIQAIKAGILEVGDMFVVNKYDRDGADRTYQDLQMMIEMNSKESNRNDNIWIPPIIKTEATTGKGVDELLDEIGKHRFYLGQLKKKNKFQRQQEKIREELKDMVKEEALKNISEKIKNNNAIDEAVDAVIKGEKDPYTACDELVKRLAG